MDLIEDGLLTSIAIPVVIVTAVVWVPLLLLGWIMLKLGITSPTREDDAGF